ncbi:hypothetical protein ACQEUX_06825 [Micromonospora sp. CA-259024]
MTHGVSFIDEHRHDPRSGRFAAPMTGAARVLRACHVGVHRGAPAGYRHH